MGLVRKCGGTNVSLSLNFLLLFDFMMILNVHVFMHFLFEVVSQRWQDESYCSIIYKMQVTASRDVKIENIRCQHVKIRIGGSILPLNFESRMYNF